MLSCQELTEVVTDYLEGRMRLLDRLRFRLHVGMCPHCRAYLKNQRALVRAIGHMPAEPIPPAVKDELLERFRGWRSEQGPVPK